MSDNDIRGECIDITPRCSLVERENLGETVVVTSLEHHSSMEVGEPHASQIIHGLACELANKASAICTAAAILLSNYSHIIWEFRHKQYPQGWWEAPLRSAYFRSPLRSIPWLEVTTKALWMCPLPPEHVYLGGFPLPKWFLLSTPISLKWFQLCTPQPLPTLKEYLASLNIDLVVKVQAEKRTPPPSHQGMPSPTSAGTRRPHNKKASRLPLPVELRPGRITRSKRQVPMLYDIPRGLTVSLPCPRQDESETPPKPPAKKHQKNHTPPTPKPAPKKTPKPRGRPPRAAGTPSKTTPQHTTAQPQCPPHTAQKSQSREVLMGGP